MEVRNSLMRSGPHFVRRRKKTTHAIIKNEQPNAEWAVESFQKEKKILNWDKNAFMAASELFEKALNELIIDNDEEVYETLLKLKDVIQAKLLIFNCGSEGRCGSEYDTLSIKNLGSSKSLASSTLSLSSEKSVSVQSLAGNNTYINFLKEVNCPFCSEVAEDKINLIKHLDGNCQSVINNEFEESNFISYSAFQILPNNTIKCNVCPHSVLKSLKYFFKHLQNQKHKSEYAKAARIKNYTEFLFCSCCKVLVPNNYTQLDFHMNLKIHKIRSSHVPQISELLKNFDCVYLRSKKFKCLICPSRYICQSAKDILEHFEKECHGEKLKNGKFPNAFCEICMKHVFIFEILSHLNSHYHIQKEKSAGLQGYFETCYYCGFVCSSLKELSVHMLNQCKEITIIRKQNVATEKLHKNDTKNESEKHKNENSGSKNNMPTERIIERENTKESQHIIVKDNTDVLEVYKYFTKFGEITRVEIYEDKNVLVQFRDKSAFKDVLLLQDVIHINGVKLEITTDEVLSNPVNALKELEKGIASDEENLLESSDESHSNSNDSTSEMGPLPNKKLEDLFQRVSHHLSNRTKIFDSSLENKILEDCAGILDRNRNYFVIGFAGTRLSFPLEMMDLYCDVSEECSAMQSLSDVFRFTENIMKQLYIKLCDISKWQAVNCHGDSSFPYIECTHVATRKTCRLLCSPSAKLLTDMLSYCIEKLDVAKDFCMIVRFWFTVHKLEIGRLDFVIISLLIFFLVNNYIASNVLEICNAPNTIVLLSAKLNDIGFKQLRRGVKSKLPSEMPNVVEMFQDFLAFLCKFNFRKKMIVLPLDFGIPRKVIDKEGFDCFFKSFRLNELQDSAMCILDPLLQVNLTKDIHQDDLEALLQAARNTLKNTG